MAIPVFLFSVLLAAALTMLGWHLGARRARDFSEQRYAASPALL